MICSIVICWQRGVEQVGIAWKLCVARRTAAATGCGTCMITECSYGRYCLETARRCGAGVGNRTSLEWWACSASSTSCITCVV
jgi:hypothetical protein